MWYEQINKLAEFITLDPTLFHNVISIIIYLIVIFFALKHGSSWINLLIAYAIISLVMSFFGLDSYLNIFNILDLLLTSIFGGGGFTFKGIWEKIKGFFSFKGVI